jgi:hypothetical protein
MCNAACNAVTAQSVAQGAFSNPTRESPGGLPLRAQSHQYDPDEHPRDRASQYDKAQRGEPTPAKTKRKA